VIAAYRIRQQQWSNQKALQEARSLGLHFYERGKMRFILAYQAGAPTPAAADTASLASQPGSSIDSIGVTTSTR
jgi:hypothetical protein